MPYFPITYSVEEALKGALLSPVDSLGYCYHTFRVALSRSSGDWSVVLSRLVDAGWQLQGGPNIIEVSGMPRHLVLSMILFTPPT